MAKRITIAGPGGRTIEVETAGPEKPQGTVIFHTGTPSAGTLFDAHIEAGAARGLGHVSYARPGYAGSERAPGRLVADCAADVVAVADALGIERFYTVGWSGGGAHALACAALLAERTLAAASIAGVAPWGAAGLDYTAGMAQENIDELGAAVEGERALAALLESQVADFASLDGESIKSTLAGFTSDVDRRALTGAMADHLALDFRRSASSGIWGWLDDDLEWVRAWGFDLEQIESPVAIWQGGEDRFVPYAHGEWLAAHIDGARAHLLPEEGHISIVVDRYGEVLDELLAVSA